MEAHQALEGRVGTLMHADTLRKTQLRNRATQIARLQQHIMRHLGCANCGAPAGKPCKHDYGCIDRDRTVR